MEALCDILITGLDVCHVFELKDNLTGSTVWNTGETGDIYPSPAIQSLLATSVVPSKNIVISNIILYNCFTNYKNNQNPPWGLLINNVTLRGEGEGLPQCYTIA